MVEVEPEAVVVNGNGSNGHYNPIDIGLTVELVLGNGHVPPNGNGHHDEAPEPRRSRFSWVEFIAEEPVKPQGRNCNPQPASAPLFEWALSVDREREAELVGAGRLSAEMRVRSSQMERRPPTQAHVSGSFCISGKERVQMKAKDHRGIGAKLETNSRRSEMMEMHLFDIDASEETPLCGAGVSANDRAGVDY